MGCSRVVLMQVAVFLVLILTTPIATISFRLAPRSNQSYHKGKVMSLYGRFEDNSKLVADVVDVIDLRGTSLMIRLLALSLEGIVNRETPVLYVLWESKYLSPTASERWLEYYKSRGWISGYEIIDLWEAIGKYKSKLNGVVVFDPGVPATVNLAITLAGLYDLVIAHPDLLSNLTDLGLDVKYDLRGMFSNNLDAHNWQLENLFPYCNKSLINLFPSIWDVMIYRVSIIDYVIANRACSIGLNVIWDAELIGKYYEKMNKFAIAIGYPERAEYERPWVELTSRYGLLNVLCTSTSPNFSFHCKMPGKKQFYQDHNFNVTLDVNKIYVAFAVSDLGLNIMQSFYYEMWLSEGRGEIPIAWWLDPIVTDLCPGIVQYYYETKTPNDYFYSAHVGGRIRPSDFPYLEDYLRRGQRYLNRCSLKIVGYSNHNKKDSRVFELYSTLLDIEGVIFGFGPEFEEECWLVNDTVWIVPRYIGSPDNAFNTIKKYINSHPHRPLFIVIGIGLWYYPKVSQVIEIKNNLESTFGDEIVICRLDELVAAAKKYLQLYGPINPEESRIPLVFIVGAIILIAIIAVVVTIIVIRPKSRKGKSQNQ